MKFTQLLFYPALLLFALSCGQTATEQESETTTETTETTETVDPEANGAPYTITVLNADLPSPRKEMTGSIDGVDITINYGSPSVRGRTVWDGLVPYDKVWRSGANEATTIALSGDAQIEGETLAAGRYSLFTIPGEKSWTIIFNSVPDQWGNFEYDESKDVFRVEDVQTKKMEHAEQMDFLIEGNSILLHWEKIAVPFEVATAASK